MGRHTLTLKCGTLVFKLYFRMDGFKGPDTHVVNIAMTINIMTLINIRSTNYRHRFMCVYIYTYVCVCTSVAILAEAVLVRGRSSLCALPSVPDLRSASLVGHGSQL